jgi:hypothetical protein
MMRAMHRAYNEVQKRLVFSSEACLIKSLKRGARSIQSRSLRADLMIVVAGTLLWICTLATIPGSAPSAPTGQRRIHKVCLVDTNKRGARLLFNLKTAVKENENGADTRKHAGF